MIPHENYVARADSIMAEDQAQTSKTAGESPKDLVLAAIRVLRQKGQDINPYTVANEANLPRSTIYRNAELMDLVSSAEPSEKLQPKQAGYTDRIAELEAEVEQLGQTIWNLETQNEELQKDFQDAWTMGFAAGLEEAQKRFARAQSGEEEPEKPPVMSVFSVAPEETAQAPTPQPPVITPVTPIPAAASAHSETGDNTPLPTPPEASPVPTFHRQPSSMTTSQRMNAIIDFTTAAEAAAVEAAVEAATKAAGKAAVDPVISDRIIFADPPGGEFNSFGDFGDDLLYASELLEAAENKLYNAPQPAPPKPKPDFAPAGARSAPAYTIDFSQADTGNYHDPLGEAAQNVATMEARAVALETAPKPTPAAEVFAAQHQYDEASGIYNVARSGPYVASEFNPLIELSWKDIEDVYNYRASTLKDYARNVPSAPTKLITPLLSEHEGNGDTIADLDPSILAMMPSDDELANLQHHETAVYMTDEVADVMPEVSGYIHPKEDPDATGDRLQAMVGYRPDLATERGIETPMQPPPAPPQEREPINAEGILDLDAIDIFDNLDEWIDIDRLERGEDPFTKPQQQQTVGREASTTGGDELRELVKNRIKQSAELGPDTTGKPPFGTGGAAGAAKTGPAGQGAAAAAPAGGAGDAAEGIPRPKNKFIGGKAGGETPPPPAQSAPFVKQIPQDIRKACMILGVRPDEITREIVVETWKQQIIKVHPDQGGDTEAAIFLNTAKDTIIHWIDAQAPKLGKKWGAGQRDKDKDKS